VDRTAPSAFFAVPDGYFKSERSVAGPLRRGTANSVGPRSGAANGPSDMGMDRVEQKPVDRIGVKYPETDPPVPLISRELRGPPRRE